MALVMLDALNGSWNIGVAWISELCMMGHHPLTAKTQVF